MIAAAIANPHSAPDHKNSDLSLKAGDIRKPNRGAKRRIATISSVKKYSRRCDEVR
jgi:hypothetical protein